MRKSAYSCVIPWTQSLVERVSCVRGCRSLRLYIMLTLHRLQLGSGPLVTFSSSIAVSLCNISSSRFSVCRKRSCSWCCIPTVFGVPFDIVPCLMCVAQSLHYQVHVLLQHQLLSQALGHIPIRGQLNLARFIRVSSVGRPFPCFDQQDLYCRVISMNVVWRPF